MSKKNKILFKILNGLSDKDITFSEIINLLQSLGFILRVKGSHHIFYKIGIEEIINLQPQMGKVKPYQVKQVRELIVKYKLNVSLDE